MRVDNGNPWVCPDSDLPTDLELWLAGLDVALPPEAGARGEEFLPLA